MADCPTAPSIVEMVKDQTVVKLASVFVEVNSRHD